VALTSNAVSMSFKAGDCDAGIRSDVISQDVMMFFLTL
jgi:hypothetical protein